MNQAEPSYSSSHIFHPHILRVPKQTKTKIKENGQFHLNILEEATEIINCIKSHLFDMHLLNIPFDKGQLYMKYFAAYWSMMVAFRKNTYNWVVSWTRYFFIDTIFTWENDRQTNDSYSGWGYLVEHFLKMNKVSLSRQGKELTRFVANDKIGASKWKLQFLGNVYLPLCVFLISKDFSDNFWVDVNKQQVLTLQNKMFGRFGRSS